jgi:hypothetical protein
MAASQLNNSARQNQPTPPPISVNSRVDVGVIMMSRAPDHLGWRLVTSNVRRYRSLSPEGRSLLHAFMVALALTAILIRLIVIVEG